MHTSFCSINYMHLFTSGKTLCFHHENWNACFLFKKSANLVLLPLITCISRLRYSRKNKKSQRDTHFFVFRTCTPRFASLFTCIPPHPKEIIVFMRILKIYVFGGNKSVNIGLLPLFTCISLLRFGSENDKSLRKNWVFLVPRRCTPRFGSFRFSISMHLSAQRLCCNLQYLLAKYAFCTVGVANFWVSLCFSSKSSKNHFLVHQTCKPCFTPINYTHLAAPIFRKKEIKI